MRRIYTKKYKNHQSNESKKKKLEDQQIQEVVTITNNMDIMTLSTNEETAYGEQQTQEAVIITNNMAAMTLSTYEESAYGESTTEESKTWGSTSEDDVEKQRKWPYQNVEERGRRDKERIYVNSFNDYLSNATDVRPRIVPRISGLAMSIKDLKRQNRKLSQRGRILKPEMMRRKWPQLNPLLGLLRKVGPKENF